MLSILVAHSYFLEFDRKQRQRAKPYPPLATLQVASFVRQQGHCVAMFDAMLASGVAEFERQLRSVRPQVLIVYEDNYNYLSKMCLGRMREAACQMIALAQRAGARVIVAGSDASDAPDEYLAAGAAAVLLGEGMAALRELLCRLDSHLDADAAELCEGIAGVVSQTRGLKPPRSLPPSAPPQADQPPAAAWDLIDVGRYRSVWLQAHGYFSLNMAASRGCSFRCSWCAKPIWGNRYLQRSAADVAAEMAHLKHTFEPDHIWFADDIFGFRVDWVADFSAAAHALDGSVPFTIQTRADLMSESMTHALKAARCKEVWLGVESGSQRILDAMNKGIAVSDVPVARARLAAAQIRVGFFIQLGYLGEELDDILATRTLIENTRPDDIGVSVAYPLPGTKFYELVKEQLRAKTHWRESNDLEMMFEGTYSSDFYREIRDLLHEQVGCEKIRREHGREAYENARRSVEWRWDALLSQEFSHRSTARALPGATAHQS